MKFYDLIIVSNEYFPFGQAASNRIVCYATAISQKKSVLYLTQAGPLYADNWGNIEKDGEYRGVEFHYMGEVNGRRPNAIVRFYRLVYRYVKLLFQLSFVYKTKSIIVVNNKLTFDLFIKVICLLRGIKLFNEINETPLRKYPQSKAPIVRKISSMYDGFLIIAPGIRDYYPNIPQSKFFLLPMLVDMDRFKAVEKQNNKYISYCSGANLERDGFWDILNGFVTFRKSFPDYILKVATSLNLSDDYHKKCKGIIDEHPESIEYLGQISTTQIPELIMGSTCLLVTPHHKYDTVGFPTKLGEFFATGNPVIISSIPDLQMIPNDCAYIVEPNRPDLIALAMSEIVSEPAKAARIGCNGYKYAFERFTIYNYLDDLISFIQI